MIAAQPNEVAIPLLVGASIMIGFGVAMIVRELWRWLRAVIEGRA